MRSTKPERIDVMSETIDVGPVWCPTCKREYGNTEAEALREALRIAVEGLDASVRELVDLGGNDGP